VILHFTDPHFRKDIFEIISFEANRLGADVCISGDFIDLRNTETSIEEQVDWVRTWFKSQKFRLFLCSGNHDELLGTDLAGWVAELHDGKKIVTDGQSGLSKSGAKIYCMEFGAYAADRDITEAIAGADIIVTHLSPRGTRTSTNEFMEDWGDEMLRVVVDAFPRAKRQLILCGHVHKPRAQVDRIGKVTIANPGFPQNGRLTFGMIGRVTHALTKVPVRLA